MISPQTLSEPTTALFACRGLTRSRARVSEAKRKKSRKLCLRGVGGLCRIRFTLALEGYFSLHRIELGDRVDPMPEFCYFRMLIINNLRGKFSGVRCVDIA
jgi:hypothetical protein